MFGKFEVKKKTENTIDIIQRNVNNYPEKKKK